MNNMLFCCLALILSLSLNACYFDSTGDLAVEKLQVSVRSVDGDSSPGSLPKGFSQSLVATATLFDGSTRDVTHLVRWRSSNQTVVKVADQKASAVAVGSADISAMLRGIESNQLSINVTDAVLVQIQITPPLVSLPVGIVHNYQALASFSDSSVMNVTDQVIWTLGDSGIATMDAGRLTTLLPGFIGLTATLLNVQSNLVELHVTDTELVSIQVTPSDYTIAFGTNAEYLAIGTYTDSSTQDLSSLVEWYSSETNVATIADGLATAVSQGSTNINASLNGVSSNSVELTVTAEELVSIQITPALSSLPEGGTQVYVATGTYTDNSTQDISHLVAWNSSAINIATIVDGLAIAVDEGTSVISASLHGVSSSATLTVIEEELVSIQVTPALSSLPEGGTQVYIATGTYTDDSTLDISHLVAWNSSATDIATIVDGLAIAVDEGSTVISASLHGVSSSATLTVIEEELVSIQVTPALSSLPEGGTQVYIATGTYTDDSTLDISHLVAWNSSATDIATIVDGLAIAVDEGSTVISASLHGVSSSATLTVIEEELVSIQVTPALSSLPEGGTQVYIATGIYSDNSTQNISNLVAWNSSDTRVATIIGGLATAVIEGNSVISATLGDITSNSGALTITAEELVSIQITPATSSIAKGITQPYVATGTYTDSSTQDISNLVAWNSSNTSIATIVDGLATATAQGVSVVSASLGGIHSNNATQTVTAEELVSVQLTPTVSSIAKGNTQGFVATGTYTDNSIQDISSSVSWNSSDTGVATVVDGLVTGVIEGNSTITASLAGFTINNASLTVTAAVLASIEVSVPSELLVTGRASTYSATGVYSDNTTADLTSLADWSSDNAAIATVTDGNAVAVATGAAVFTVSYNGINSPGTNLLVVDTVPVCGANPASGDCIMYSTGLSGNAAGKLFTAGPSLPVVSAMGYTVMNQGANTGLTYGQAIAEDGEYGPEGTYVRFRNDGVGNGQYDRFCLDLNTIVFDGKTNWRRATRFELSDLFADYGNMFVNQGWPVRSGYWSSNYYGYSGTYDSDLYWFVAMLDGSNYTQVDWTPRPASCVSE
ncbi:Ig-like domain-containing protein [Agarivorans sp. 1_MG-2023]|uniref:Ig-like domain-containing protein n=1 Tax=Agarivorans sp. 1_MG-2023 TaxID=3062634 RepID=UPI0026E372E1|nr:Ig-like domain-containing protein [Agarivorans sp. 1_MG-2023]MDO6764076.1 Ig-like domain-containing protein [Agarivorans sp. 1_MG-2023]